MRLLVLAFVALAACSRHSSRIVIHGYGNVHATVDGFEYRAERDRNSDVTWVAVYRDGALHGADRLSASERARMGLRRDPLADHPQLAEWRARLARLSAIAGDERADTGAFADAAVGFPFSLPTNEAALRFTKGRPGRAAALLDRADDLALGESAAVTLVERALDAEGIDDARIAAWARSRTLREQDTVLLRLARAPAAGPKTALALLARIDELHGSDRPQIYRAAGAKLVARPEHAAQLARALDELYGSDRPEAALALLSRDDASPAFAVAVLASIDDFYGSDRVAVFRRAAPVALGEGQAPLVVRALVEELYGSERAHVARWLVGLPDARPALVAGLARELGEFYGSERRHVLDALVSSAGFAGDAQREVVRAAIRELHGDERAAALARIAATPDLDPGARSLLQSARGG